MRNIIILLSSFLLISCTRVKDIYQNKSERCTLKLMEDGTYTFKHPVFIGPDIRESGTYTYNNKHIILTYESTNKKPEIDIGYVCLEDNPDTLRLTFKNLYKEQISTKIKINGNDFDFQSDTAKIKYVSYSHLQAQGIINANEKIQEISISYQGMEYTANLSVYNNPRRPNRLDFTLNQFKDQKLDILQRKYQIKGDTILINDISAKVLGVYNRALIKIN